VQAKEVTRWHRFPLVVALGRDILSRHNEPRDSGSNDINDKVEHSLAFYVLALLADFSCLRRGFGVAKIIFLLGCGLAIEINAVLPALIASLPFWTS
jgi:hypothetical protein